MLQFLLMKKPGLLHEEMKNSHHYKNSILCSYSKLMNLFGSILRAIFEGTNEARRGMRKSPAVIRERYSKGILNSISHPKDILFTTWMNIMLIIYPSIRPNVIPAIPVIPADSIRLLRICFQFIPRYLNVLISLFFSKTRTRRVLIIPINETSIAVNSMA